MFAGRTTTDVVVIIFALAIAWAIVAAGATIGLLALTDRADEASDVIGYFENAITTIVGAMLGLVAGRAAGRDKNKNSAVDNGTTTPREEPTP